MATTHIVKPYKTRTGYTVELDISDNACLKFGFKHGDLVLTPVGYSIVIGVDHAPLVGSNLWFRNNDSEGVSYWGSYTKKDFEEKGFKKVQLNYITTQVGPGTIIIILNPGPVCEETFGFSPGDIVKTPEGLATVVGVEFEYLKNYRIGIDLLKPKNLWFQSQNGKFQFQYWDNYFKKEFKREGFVKNQVSTLYDLCFTTLENMEINTIIVPEIQLRDEVIDLLKSRIRERLTEVRTAKIRRKRFKELHQTFREFLQRCMRAEIAKMLEIRGKWKL